MSGQLGNGWTLGRCVAVGLALALLVLVVGAMVASSSGPTVRFVNEQEVP